MNAVKVWLISFVGAVLFINAALIVAQVGFEAFKHWPYWVGFPLIVAIALISYGFAVLVVRWSGRREAGRRRQ
jgi:hypothetical protein